MIIKTTLWLVSITLLYFPFLPLPPFNPNRSLVRAHSYPIKLSPNPCKKARWLEKSKIAVQANKRCIKFNINMEYNSNIKVHKKRRLLWVSLAKKKKKKEGWMADLTMRENIIWENVKAKYFDIKIVFSILLYRKCSILCFIHTKL